MSTEDTTNETNTQLESNSTTAAETPKKSTTKKVIAEVVAAPIKPYAVIRSGGKQYKVTEGQKIKVELLSLEDGETVTFSDILMAGGAEKTTAVAAKGSALKGVSVTGKVIGTLKNKKVLIFKKRIKGGYTKKQGHRQHLTEVLIEQVSI